MGKIKWNIQRDGRAWNGEEALKRYDLIPEKIEMLGGKLFLDEDDRLIMLGLLLENIGADKAVRLGNPEVWCEAIKTLDEQKV